MQAILFDYGGTIDGDGVTWMDRFLPLYRDEGLQFDRPAFEQAFYAADDGLAKRHRLPGLGLEETMRLQAASLLEALAPDARGVGDRVVDRFITGCRATFQRNRPVLERLKARHRLGIVSNFYGNLDGILAREGLRDLFHVVADSGVVGAEKPSPVIFQHALRALDCPVSNAVMVGDSIPRDMRGAEGLGMPHILVSPGGPPCCPAGRMISGLTQLERALGATAAAA